MKKYLFVVVALLALVGQANAQRYLPGMRGVELRGGFVDGVQKPVNYYLGVGLSTYTKNGNRWVFGPDMKQAGGEISCCRTGRHSAIRIRSSMVGR